MADPGEKSKALSRELVRMVSEALKDDALVDSLEYRMATLIEFEARDILEEIIKVRQQLLDYHTDG